MNDQVLVAYASKYGATAEIAEKIGETLRQAGLRADVLPAEKVRDLTPYNAVVLGSAVYIGQWRKQAANFLKNNQKALAERAVWLFSSGPAGDGDPMETLSRKTILCARPNECDRWLFIAFTIRKNRIRVISARDMSQNERKAHAKTNP